MRTSFGVVMWLVLCASLALVWGSGASRFVGGNPPDSWPMFWVGAALFAVAGVGALVIRSTGKPVGQDSLVGIVFFAVTGLGAMVAGVVLDSMN